MGPTAKTDRAATALSGLCIFHCLALPVAASAAPFLAAMAEAENHHPKISLEWGKVSVEWWTGEIGGLHRNDFIGAAKTDKLYQSA